MKTFASPKNNAHFPHFTKRFLKKSRSGSFFAPKEESAGKPFFHPASLQPKMAKAEFKMFPVYQKFSPSALTPSIQRAPDTETKDWTPPTAGVVQAWMYNQIDNWHTGAKDALGFFLGAVKEESSVGFWLGLAGNTIWALSALGSPVTATIVGLSGVAIGTIGSRVQEHKDLEESKRIEAIYQDYLWGFNEARRKMNKKVIPESNRVMKLKSFQDALAKKDTDAWQQVIREETHLPEGDDINKVTNTVERNLYNIYLKERGAWVYHDIFNLPSPHHPGTEAVYKHFYTHRIPKKVIERLKRIGVDWRRIDELPVPHRHKDMYRKEGTVGAIEYWNYTENTMFPPGWTKKDISDFYAKVPSYLKKETKGVTY